MEQFKITGEPDTIAAVSTPAGTGGIAVIRVSGPQAIKIVNKAWKGKSLVEEKSHTAHLGRYYSSEGDLLDECVATIFKAPGTFTGEDVVELSVHGSKWIQREVLADLIRRGVRAADPGEFTRRAFMNGRLDLAQAEGVADLIASSSKAAHRLAVTQTRGSFSKEFDNLREKLIEFASLLELELDFSEEEVEFADRKKLLELSQTILSKVERLRKSFSSGSVLKEGVPVVIAGIPNAGKSSLLNLLLNDDKAIVSDIPGTTRDSIEDTVEIDGILYRFIDTAGLRESTDTVEKIGIERARNLMKKAKIVIWLLDPFSPFRPQQEEIHRFIQDNPETKLILLRNKSDLHKKSDSQNKSDFLKNESDILKPNLQLRPDNFQNPQATYTPPNYSSDILQDKDKREGVEAEPPSVFSNSETSPLSSSASPESAPNPVPHPGSLESAQNPVPHPGSLESAQNPVPSAIISEWKDIPKIRFSAKTGEGLPELIERLGSVIKGEFNPENELIITNLRHYEALTRGKEALQRAIAGIESCISGDFIAQDVREALHHIGTITGAITTPTLLQSIFSRFCIGK